MKHRFDPTRPDLYEYKKPVERTRKRLLQIANMGMEEVSFANFGIAGVISGLYIESIWNDTDAQFESYLDWVKEMIV